MMAPPPFVFFLLHSTIHPSTIRNPLPPLPSILSPRTTHSSLALQVSPAAGVLSLTESSSLSSFERSRPRPSPPSVPRPTRRRYASIPFSLNSPSHPPPFALRNVTAEQPLHTDTLTLSHLLHIQRLQRLLHPPLASCRFYPPPSFRSASSLPSQDISISPFHPSSAVPRRRPSTSPPTRLDQASDNLLRHLHAHQHRYIYLCLPWPPTSSCLPCRATRPVISSPSSDLTSAPNPSRSPSALRSRPSAQRTTAPIPQIPRRPRPTTLVKSAPCTCPPPCVPTYSLPRRSSPKPTMRYRLPAPTQT